MARERCTELCTKPTTGLCTLCDALDASDAFWRCSGLVMLEGWIKHLGRSITDEGGYRIVVGVLAAFVGAYVGLYAIIEARYERRLNRATFERSTFTALVTSNSRGSFIAAMNRFGPIQTMEVPPEPYLWWPWSWWGKPSQPNREPLRVWASHYLPLCTPQLCGYPSRKHPTKVGQGLRIYLDQADFRRADLRGLDLGGAYLDRADLRGANLRDAFLMDAFLHRANLQGANLQGANLHSAFLNRADLRDADFRYAYLGKAALSDTDLRGAIFQGADLVEAFLNRADLRGADFRGAMIGNAILYLIRGVDLPAADLTGIKWDSTTLWPEGFIPPPSR